MDEQYIQDLWNWTTSQDPTFKDRYTFESWSQKLRDDEGYRKTFHSWVSSQDNTFAERRPFNSWSKIVGGGIESKPTTEQAKGIGGKLMDVKKKSFRNLYRKMVHRYLKRLNQLPRTHLQKNLLLS